MSLRAFFFALLLLVADSHAITYQQWCFEVGGFYVTPDKSLQKDGPGECHCIDRLGNIPRRISKPDDRCWSIPVERFCKSPATYICQSKEADTEADSMREYESAKMMAPLAPTISHLTRNWEPEKREAALKGDFAKLNEEEAKTIMNLLNNELKPFAAENHAKVEEFFLRAQAATIRSLENRKRRFPQYTQTLDKMIEEVRNTEYLIGWSGPTPDGMVPDNMVAQSASLRKRFGERAPEGGRIKNRILVGGMIRQLKHSPETFYFSLLHEFGHFIDPHEFPVDPTNVAAHPFHKILECFRRPDSIGAKYADAGKDQIREAFADWQARESWLGERNYRLEYGKREMLPHPLQPGPIEAIETWNRPTETLRLMREINMHYCATYRHYEREHGITRENNADSHPIGLDRANAILASPVIKKALGCPDAYIHTTKDPYGLTRQDGITADCGDDLYAGDKPHKPPTDTGAPEKRHYK